MPPLHPYTVHFPIVLYLLGVLFTGIHLWRNAAETERFAGWCFGLSAVATLAACLLGLVDQGQLAPTDPRLDVVNAHITAGVALLIINGLLVYMRARWPNVLARYRWRYLGVMALGLVAVVASGWLGGELVYRLHVGISPGPGFPIP